MNIKLKQARRYTESLIYQHASEQLSLDDFMEKVRGPAYVEKAWVVAHLKEVLERGGLSPEEKESVLLYVEAGV